MTEGTGPGIDHRVDAVLRDKEAELEAELGGLTTPSGDDGGIGFGKRVGEGTSIAVERISQVAAHDRLQSMLADVRRARAKLVEGSYGVCDRCGRPIGEERLEVLPWAVLCVQDAASS